MCMPELCARAYIVSCMHTQMLVLAFLIYYCKSCLLLLYCNYFSVCTMKFRFLLSTVLEEVGNYFGLTYPSGSRTTLMFISHWKRELNSLRHKITKSSNELKNNVILPMINYICQESPGLCFNLN